MSRHSSHILKTCDPVRLGFLAVSDCAPLVYAQEAGLFARYDLDVELHRETRWSDLRDKVISGALDAAHCPAFVPFLANLGIDSDYCACVSALVLNLEGNAVTLSRQLHDEGVHNAHTLRDYIYRHWGKKRVTLAFSHNFSSQYYLLQKWLKSAGIAPDREVRLVVVPPSQMFPTLKLGYIDGFCVGNPWTALALEAEVGVCVATSAELSPLHPEKVLMVRQSFASGRPDEHDRLVAALLEACAWCDLVQNRASLADLLAQPQYLNVPATCVSGLVRSVTEPTAAMNLDVFHRHDANDPTDQKAGWIMEALYELLELHPVFPARKSRAPILKNIFRRDIFDRASSLASVVSA